MDIAVNICCKRWKFEVSYHCPQHGDYNKRWWYSALTQDEMVDEIVEADLPCACHPESLITEQDCEVHTTFVIRND